MPNKYYTQVRQPENYPLVEINIFVDDPEEHPWSGGISSVCRWDYDDQELKFYVRPNVVFDRDGGYSPDEVDDICDWWRIAAQGIGTLKCYISSILDFNQKFEAQVIGKSLVITVLSGKE